MNNKLIRKISGNMKYYVCSEINIRHAFTTKSGGVSTGDLESLNLGFSRGDKYENVIKNYQILSNAIDIPFDRITTTKQVHKNDVSVVTEEYVGSGIHKPLAWESDALITNLKNTPLAGFYADCVVSLLYDPVSECCGVCHSGWRGTAQEILPRTVEKMQQYFNAKPEDIICVIGPSIGVCCFETDADVPEAMENQMGEKVRPFIHEKGKKFHVDLQGINGMLLKNAGLNKIINSDICTYCHSDEFWSHRVTNGKRGVQAGIICL